MTDLSTLRSHKKHWVPASLLLIALLIPQFAGWGKNGGSSDEIRIAVVMPIPGGEAKPGQYQREGIKLAIRQINDQGGIMVKDKGKKLPIKEIFYDDGSD